MKRRWRQKKGWRRVEGEIGRKIKGSKGGGKAGERGKGEETKEEKEAGEAREKDNTISLAWRVLSMIGKCINCIECT